MLCSLSACSLSAAAAKISTVCWLQVLEGHNEAVLALAVGDTFLVSGSYGEGGVSRRACILLQIGCS